MNRAYKICRGRTVAVAAVLGLLAALALPASPASAYTTTGCKWPTSTGNVTWNNTVTPGTYETTAKAAALSWASRTDVNSMVPNSSAAMYAYETNDGANGYDGMTTWTCAFGNYLGANVTVNTHYLGAYAANKKQAVWVHEFGHGLGLNHGPSNAIMYTCAACVYNTYGYYYPVSDDITGMNTLY